MRNELRSKHSKEFHFYLNWSFWSEFLFYSETVNPSNWKYLQGHCSVSLCCACLVADIPQIVAFGVLHLDSSGTLQFKLNIYCMYGFMIFSWKPCFGLLVLYNVFFWYNTDPKLSDVFSEAGAWLLWWKPFGSFLNQIFPRPCDGSYNSGDAVKASGGSTSSYRLRHREAVESRAERDILAREFCREWRFIW